MDCQNGFWYFQLRDLINTLVLVATVVAIYIGPIRAVKITRDNDERREKRRREIEIFFNLMRTRRAILDPLRVMALNLIEAEFFGNTKIIDTYRAYIVNLEKYLPDNPPQNLIDQFLRDREDAFFLLIHSIGEHLGYSFDKRDLQKFSYSPQGWQNVELENQNFRRLVIELLLGHRPLPVTPFTASDVNKKFPPPPNP
jgi:hypothetical protein